MANLSDDFFLGVAGIRDLASNAIADAEDKALNKVGLGGGELQYLADLQRTHEAAKVFGEQASADPDGQYSASIKAQAQGGATPEQIQAQATAAGAIATDNGAITEAAANTAKDVADKAKKAADDAGGLFKFVLDHWKPIAVVGGLFAGALGVAYVVRAFR